MNSISIHTNFTSVASKKKKWLKATHTEDRIGPIQISTQIVNNSFKFKITHSNITNTIGDHAHNPNRRT